MTTASPNALSLDEIVRQVGKSGLEFISLVDDFRHEPDLAAQAADAGPKGPELAAQAGNLASYAEQQLIAIVCKNDPEATTCLRAKLGQLRAELSSPTDTTVMRLLTDRVVMDWLDCYHWDLLTGHGNSASKMASAALVRGKQAAHRRYLASLKMHSMFREKFQGILRPAKGGQQKPTPTRQPNGESCLEKAQPGAVSPKLQEQKHK